MKYIVDVPHFRYDGDLYSVGMLGTILYENVDEWLSEEIGERGVTWEWPNSDVFEFLEESDAVAFKLRWL